MYKTKFLDHLLKDDLVKSNGKTEIYKKNFILKTSLTKITEIGIVIDGYLKGVNYTKDGKELCNSIFSPSSIILEYLYLSGIDYYIYDLIALTKVKITWVPADIFKAIIYDDIENLKLYVEHLASRGLENQRLINCLSYKTIRDRICYWVVSENNLEMDYNKIPSKVEIDISQGAFSEFLCVSRASLSQELHKMEEEGFFMKRKNSLENIDKYKIFENL